MRVVILQQHVRYLAMLLGHTHDDTMVWPQEVPVVAGCRVHTNVLELQITRFEHAVTDR